MVCFEMLKVWKNFFLCFQVKNKVTCTKYFVCIWLWQENVPKINVEKTKGNSKFYLYLYPLRIYFKEVYQKASNLHVAHVHPCANYEWTKTQLKVN
jgi:hypothetical protein